MAQQAVAKLNFLKMAPRKVRLLANVIRGLPAMEAEVQLMHRSRRAAGPLLKLLRSGLANARGLNLDAARLFVATITVDQGPVMKRTLPRAQGRATPILKKMSHIKLILAEAPSAAPLRFAIVKPAKVEKKKEAAKKKKTAVNSASSESFEKPKEKTGFFRRIFRRKSV